MATTIAFVNWASPDILYAGTWATYGSHAHKGSSVPGSYFTFDFNGTQVWVSGTIYPLQGRTPWAVTFTVDGKTPAAILTGPDASADQVNTSFWVSPTLAGDKEHTLTVEVVSATTNTPFLLDRLLFIPSNPQPTTTQNEVTYSTTTPPQVTVTVSAVPDGKSSVPTGAIVGGVIAGVTALVIAGILAYYFLRRRRYGKAYFYHSTDATEMLRDEHQAVPLFDAKRYSDDHPAVHEGVEPMLPPTLSSQNASQSAYSRSEYSQSSYAPSVHTTSQPISQFGDSSLGPSYAHTITPYQPSPPSSAFTSSSSQPSSKAAEAGLLPVPARTMYHADSGIRFGGPSRSSGPGQATGSGTSRGDLQESPTDVPPSYTPN